MYQTKKKNVSNLFIPSAADGIKTAMAVIHKHS